ncbi:hypothetical protein ACFQ3F_19640 [Nocardioides ginsengisoli]|uniref:LamG domain-containing protein n=1 Tax=Nocardioides ginsengisoli TaxID=363868 RepID=A0ABW3W664_9ACTN
MTGLDLALDFDQVVVPGDPVPGAENDGKASVRVEVVTAGGGRLIWVEGLGGGAAVRTPPHSRTGPVRAAVMVVWPDIGQPDLLSPGTHDLDFGLDFRADPPTAGRPGDDGDNLMQRGRFDGSAQYKLQVDHGIPSCRLVGSRGEVLVKATKPVTPDRWYRISCVRRAGEVRLRLDDLQGGEPPQSWVVARDPGNVAFHREPVSIGAKVGVSGRIDARSADQFSGEFDRVHVDVR